MPTVKEILIEWLTEHGYTGLHYKDECGCCIDDLIPCSEPCDTCEAGYSGPDFYERLDDEEYDSIQERQ